MTPARGALLMIAVLVTGCSLALTAPDPERPRNRPPECDTGKGLVAADGLFAALLGITGLALASENASDGVAPLLIGALFVGSAVRGNGAVEECRKAMTAYTTDQDAARWAEFQRLQQRPKKKRIPRSRPSDDDEDPQDRLVRPVQPVVVQPAPVQPQPMPPQPTPPQVAQPEPAQPAPPKKSPKPAQDAEPSRDDPWRDFWREVR